MRLLIIILGISVAAFCQPTPHSVTLSWDDTQNPTGTTYNLYRAPLRCSQSTNPAFAAIASGITAKTYVDTPVSVGNYCYTVRASLDGVESLDSNYATAEVRPFPPTNHKAEIK